MTGSRYRVVSLATAPHSGRSGVLIPVGAEDFSHLKNHQDLWGPLSKLCSGYQASSGRGMKLTAYVHPMPRLGMSGVVPLRSVYAFLAWIVWTLPLIYILVGHLIVHGAVYVSTPLNAHDACIPVLYVCIVSWMTAVFGQCGRFCTVAPPLRFRLHNHNWKISSSELRILFAATYTGVPGGMCQTSGECSLC